MHTSGLSTDGGALPSERPQTRAPVCRTSLLPAMELALSQWPSFWDWRTAGSAPLARWHLLLQLCLLGHFALARMLMAPLQGLLPVALALYCGPSRAAHPLAAVLRVAVDTPCLRERLLPHLAGQQLWDAYVLTGMAARTYGLPTAVCCAGLAERSSAEDLQSAHHQSEACLPLLQATSTPTLCRHVSLPVWTTKV